MIPWTDIEVRLREHERRIQHVEQTYWMQVEAPTASVDRWRWRVMNKLGSWLVELGCRLQTNVEQARQAMRASQMQSNYQSRLVTGHSTTRTGRLH